MYCQSLASVHTSNPSVDIRCSPNTQVAFSLTPDVPVLPPVLHRSTSLSSNNGAFSTSSSLGNHPLDMAAVTSSVADKSMILGRVICYHADTGAYDILDVDDSKKYLLPERQVIVLDLIESQRRLSKGELVFALYPDTTSFYPAVVSAAPRRTAMGAEPSVIVQFCGDEDTTGDVYFWAVLVFMVQYTIAINKGLRLCMHTCMWLTVRALWSNVVVHRCGARQSSAVEVRSAYA